MGMEIELEDGVEVEVGAGVGAHSTLLTRALDVCDALLRRGSHAVPPRSLLKSMAALASLPWRPPSDASRHDSSACGSWLAASGATPARTPARLTSPLTVTLTLAQAAGRGASPARCARARCAC